MIVTTDYGVFEIDPERDAKVHKALVHGGHELERIEGLPQQMGVVIDVGAHIGTWSIPLAERSAEVHAFEPIDETRSYLEKNIVHNHCSNIVVHSEAVSSDSRKLSVAVERKSNRGGTSLRSGDDIESTTLDALFSSADFIKIDVEGMEYDVLMGATKLITNAKPILHIELNRRTSRLKVFKIWWWLRRLGYTFDNHFLHRSTFNVFAFPK